MAELNTQDRLLDAAEQLIAHQGYANTSLREITSKADANLAAVNYHFGSKEKLVAAMLARRLEPFNHERLVLLEAELHQAKKEHRRPDIEALLKAFIEPAVTFFQSHTGGRHFLQMFSRVHADPDDAIRHEFLRHMIPVIQQFYSGFQEALPNVAPEKLMARIFFCIGAMGHGAGMMVDEQFKTKGPQFGFPPMPDSNAFVEDLLGFLMRGMEGS